MAIAPQPFSVCTAPQLQATMDSIKTCVQQLHSDLVIMNKTLAGIQTSVERLEIWADYEKIVVGAFLTLLFISVAYAIRKVIDIVALMKLNKKNGKANGE